MYVIGIYIYSVDNQVILTKLTLGSSKKSWKSDCVDNKLQIDEMNMMSLG